MWIIFSEESNNTNDKTNTGDTSDRLYSAIKQHEIFISCIKLMTIESLLLWFWGSIIWWGVIFFLFKNWIKVRIEQSIKHEYDKKLELYRNEIEKRNKAERVSDLLSERIAHPESQKVLNRLSIDLFLRLPDSLAEDLSSLLSHSKDNPVDIREFIGKIRKFLNPDTSFDENKIILFQSEQRKIQIKKFMEKEWIPLTESDLNRVSQLLEESIQKEWKSDKDIEFRMN